MYRARIDELPQVFRVGANMQFHIVDKCPGKDGDVTVVNFVNRMPARESTDVDYDIKFAKEARFSLNCFLKTGSHFFVSSQPTCALRFKEHLTFQIVSTMTKYPVFHAERLCVHTIKPHEDVGDDDVIIIEEDDQQEQSRRNANVLALFLTTLGKQETAKRKEAARVAARVAGRVAARAAAAEARAAGGGARTVRLAGTGAQASVRAAARGRASAITAGARFPSACSPPATKVAKVNSEKELIYETQEEENDDTPPPLSITREAVDYLRYLVSTQHVSEIKYITELMKKGRM
eukprot:GHVS01005914.1.p1 GENE.GHVS01005914.1~~GHVS01005914.1.p1  ORF type:complete len:292 (-),score=43.20 GHVS01005914.1:350-1225(-)